MVGYAVIFKNNGCRYNPPRGLTWLFEQVEQAIILEDDCVPDQTIFPYFTELLERYKDDERVMTIRGANFQHDNPNYSCPESYYFSTMASPWGWASWRRAWQKYDIDMKSWPEIKEKHLLKNVLRDGAILDRYEYLYDQYYAGRISSWDGLWTLAHLINGGLSIVPKRNMVTNIGFDMRATHSKHANNAGANLPRYPMEFPLVHPKYVVPNAVNDAYTYKHELDINRRPKQRLIWFAKSRFPKIYASLKNLKDYLRKKRN